jgi:hypothetical protein
LSDYFKIETHDSTVQLALEQLLLWLNSDLNSIHSFSKDTITKINSFLKKSLETKGFSVEAKCKIYDIIIAIYSKNSSLYQHLNVFIPICLESIEKAQHQNVTSINEALYASLVTTIYMTNDASYESKVPKFVTFLKDEKKQFLTSEKFYSNLKDQATINYWLLIENMAELNYDLSSYIPGSIFGIAHNNFKIRKQCQSVLSRTCELKNSPVCSLVLDEFHRLLNQNIDNKNLNCKGICESLLTLCNTTNLTYQQLEEISSKCLLIANSSTCLSSDRFIYDKCLQGLLKKNATSLNISSNDLFEKQLDNFFNLTTNGIREKYLSTNQLNAVQTLCRIDSEMYLKRLITRTIQLINETPKLELVKKQEFKIFQTKEGQLYDQSLLESVLKQQQNESDANIRRENKTYSYKEQLADLELRRELEAKKNKATQKCIADAALNVDKVRSIMTKKQQEQLDIQIEKEKKCRDEIKK